MALLYAKQEKASICQRLPLPGTIRAKKTKLRMIFPIWYYTVGLAGIFRLVFVFLRFTTHRFNIGGLFFTLLSPWKRDVSFQTWRGFRPILMLQALMNNLITRFLGMIVRSVVLILGIGVLVFTSVGVVLMAFAYVVAPFFLLGGSVVIGSLLGVLAGVAVFVLSAGIVLIALLAWHGASEMEHDFTLEPALAPWRRRTFLRLGLAPDEVSAATLAIPERRTAWLAERRIAPELFEEAWEIEHAAYAERERGRRFWEWEHLKRSVPIGKYWAYAYTPRLDRFVSDLSEHDFSNYRNREFIGRERVMDMLALTLTRPVDNSALLIGDPGIGKRSAVHAFAERIRENRFDEKALDEARLVLFDLGQAISVARTEGIDEKGFVRELFDEATYAGNVILVIENLELFLDPESPTAMGDVLNDYLSLPTCRVIGLMTSEAYHTLGQRQIPALKYFEAILVSEPTKAETIRILLDTFQKLEQKRPLFTLQALHAIVDGAERHNWEMPFPERAIDLAQEVLLYWEKHPTTGLIERTTVEDFLEEKSGIPMGEATAEEKTKLLNLEALLHERVIGQHEAIKQIAEAFRKARTGLGNDKKPIGSFLFLGPTGVGKTETAKALAHVYFGSEDRMVRLDMSEFQTPQAIDELVGSNEMNIQGRMTTLVKEHPYSILLLDELEKAYPRALDLFLQILDEGYVTDGFGHRVNFRNCIIIATSNAGADFIHQATEAGRSMQEIERELIDGIIAQNIFRPEFLNRFDGVVLFNSLTAEEMETVTRLKLGAFASRLYKEKKIRLEFTPEAIRTVVTRGYEREFGARSINRYIADVVEDTIVKKLLEGSLTEGSLVTFTENDLGG
jgi:ATP-dependent Clp protease ATP-binding subunit ClpC